MLRIFPATGKHLQPALELLFASLSAAARAERIAEIRQEIAEQPLNPPQLLVAEWNSVPVGVQLTIIHDGDVGMVWPPVIAVESLEKGPASFRELVEDALLRETVHCLDAAGVWIGQSLLELGQSREQAALQRNGFVRLTELRFFERSLSADASWPKRVETTAPFTYEPYHRSRNRLAFVNILDATYRGSLDCPELNGVRDGKQSLKNHEAAGSFTSDMWRLYRRDGNDLGVLLLVERPDRQAWEVLYLGVIEAARRRGLGRAMLLDALQTAREANAERMLVVVDARNRPAIALYESLDFQPADTRMAFARLAKSPHSKN